MYQGQERLTLFFVLLYGAPPGIIFSTMGTCGLIHEIHAVKQMIGHLPCACNCNVKGGTMKYMLNEILNKQHYILFTINNIWKVLLKIMSGDVFDGGFREGLSI